ncbi:MAG: DUF1232 domain-containing protein [Chloroflexota bacterium]
MYRLAIPLLLILMLRFLPGILRFLRLVWRLTFDKRVPLLLRLLVPLALLYTLSPIDLVRDRIPRLGWAADLLVLGLAMLLLTKLAPRHVVEEHLGNRQTAGRPEEKDPTKVVEGSARLIDSDK